MIIFTNCPLALLQAKCGLPQELKKIESKQRAVAEASSRRQPASQPVDEGTPGPAFPLMITPAEMITRCKLTYNEHQRRDQKVKKA